MPLFLDTGFSARSAHTESPRESCLVIVPNSDQDNTHGALLALAGGVAERPDAEAAAREAVKTLGESYYATPEGWHLEQALTECFGTANQTVRTGGERGRASALSALVLRHRHWALGHVGDTRVWCFREHELKLLTRDHVEPRIGRQARVSQACGLDETLNLDLASGEIAGGDIYVLTGDGVHSYLDSATIMSCLIVDVPASQIADCLTRRAAAAGGKRNVNACVVRVETMPFETESLSDLADTLSALPVVTPPEIGEVIDGFHIEALLHKSRPYRLYRARDEESGGIVVLKFPNPKFGQDETYADSFLREEWIGKRIHSPHLARSLPLRQGRRRALYSVMAFHEGENLAERIKRKRGLSVKESLYLTRQLLAALADLHRQGVVHRDIRPKNILLDKQHKHLVLLGLGTSRVERLGADHAGPETAVATTSYLAPELFAGEPATPSTDIYAAGVTLYRMLTGKYPYGRITPQDSAPRGEFIPPSRYQDDLSPWLEDVLQRACATDPQARFHSAEEFAEALREAELPRQPRTRPAHHRRFTLPHWELILIGVLVLGLLLYLGLIFR